MSCLICGGRGWVIQERNGVSGADRCQCSRPMPPPAPSPTPSMKDCAVATIRITSQVPYSPREDAVRLDVASRLLKLVRTTDELNWLVDAVIDQTKAWQGFAGIREIYCRRYAPELLEDSPERNEMRYIERAGEAFEGQLAEWKSHAIPGQRQPSSPPVTQSPRRRAATELEWHQNTDSTGSFCRETLDALEQRLASGMNTAPRRTAEDRARMIADLERQLQRRKDGQ